MSECPICENYRYLVLDDEVFPCYKCNWNEKYPVKNIEICLGCGRNTAERDCGCPAGTAKSLVKQDNI